MHLHNQVLVHVFVFFVFLFISYHLLNKKDSRLVKCKNRIRRRRGCESEIYHVVGCQECRRVQGKVFGIFNARNRQERVLVLVHNIGVLDVGERIVGKGGKHVDGINAGKRDWV